MGRASRALWWRSLTCLHVFPASDVMNTVTLLVLSPEPVQPGSPIWEREQTWEKRVLETGNCTKIKCIYSWFEKIWKEETAFGNIKSVQEGLEGCQAWTLHQHLVGLSLNLQFRNFLGVFFPNFLRWTCWCYRSVLQPWAMSQMFS